MSFKLITSVSVPALIGTWLGLAAPYDKYGYRSRLFNPAVGGISGGFLGLMFYLFANLVREDNKHSVRENTRINIPDAEEIAALTKEKNNNEKKLKSEVPPALVLDRVVTSI